MGQLEHGGSISQEIIKTKQRAEKAENQADYLKDTITGKETEIAQLKKDIQNLMNRIEDTQKWDAREQAEKTGLQEEAKKLKTELEGAQKSLGELKNQHDSAKGLLVKARKAKELAEGTLKREKKIRLGLEIAGRTLLPQLLMRSQNSLYKNALLSFGTNALLSGLLYKDDKASLLARTLAGTGAALGLKKGKSFLRRSLRRR